MLYIARTFDKSIGAFKIDDKDRSILHFVKEIQLTHNIDNKKTIRNYRFPCTSLILFKKKLVCAARK